MFTGQISSQALHEVQAHTSSGVMRSKRESAPMVMSPSRLSGGDTLGSPVAAMTSPVLRTISRGSRGLPVAWAGHTLVQRPHMVQASVSSSCFQVKSSTVEAPKVSSSVSIRLGMAFMAPLGRSLSRRYMFSGEVNMWRSMVTGRMARKSTKLATWRIHHTWWPPARVELSSTRADSGYQTNDHLSKSGRPARAMRQTSAPKPVTARDRKVPRIRACSGLDLMRMR